MRSWVRKIARAEKRHQRGDTPSYHIHARGASQPDQDAEPSVKNVCADEAPDGFDRGPHRPRRVGGRDDADAIGVGGSLRFAGLALRVTGRLGLLAGARRHERRRDRRPIGCHRPRFPIGPSPLAKQRQRRGYGDWHDPRLRDHDQRDGLPIASRRKPTVGAPRCLWRSPVWRAGRCDGDRGQRTRRRRRLRRRRAGSARRRFGKRSGTVRCVPRPDHPDRAPGRVRLRRLGLVRRRDTPVPRRRRRLQRTLPDRTGTR